MGELGWMGGVRVDGGARGDGGELGWMGGS